MGRASRRKRGRVPETEPVWTRRLVVTFVLAAAIGAVLTWAVMKRYAPSWSSAEAEGGRGMTPAHFVSSLGGAITAGAVMLVWLPRLPRRPTGRRVRPDHLQDPW